jgi:hypothetical protein
MSKTFRVAMLAAAALSVLAACGPTEEPEPETPPAPAPRIEALNSLQLAEVVRTFGPEGTLCRNGSRIQPLGVVPENVAEGPHAAHVGAHGYSIFCNDPGMEYDSSAYGQQWMVWVTGVEPYAATVAPCFEEGADSITENICWTPYPTQDAPPAP